jgi:aminopeptidase 2
LTTDLDSGQFCGSVKIDFSLQEENQRSIKLDSSQLNVDFSSISLTLLSPLSILSCSIEYHQRLDLLEVSLSDTNSFLADHVYRLTINSFSGHLSTENQIGFYRSSVDLLLDHDDETSSQTWRKKHYGLTQMSPTHCRRVFPCFDEPSLRATFDLTLDVPQQMQALSNMPLLTFDDNFHNSGRKRIRFQRTPSMPTFLLCFVIGEFDIVRSEPVNRLTTSNEKYVRTTTVHPMSIVHSNFRLPPIELTAYTLPGRKHEATFALDCARRALHYYADLFQIDYPMAKLDLVAVPDLFYPAMENWALILFKVRCSSMFFISIDEAMFFRKKKC